MMVDKPAKIAIIFMGIVVLALVLKTFSSFLRPLAFAAILTLVFAPLISEFKQRRIPSWVTITGIVVILFGFFYLVATLMIGEAASFQQNFGTYESQVQNIINSISNTFHIDQAALNLNEIFNIQQLGATIKAGVLTISSLITELIFVLVFMIFMMPTAHNIKNVILAKKSSTQTKKLNKRILEVQQNIRSYLWTKTIISLGTGAVSGFIFYIFGGDFAVAIGILTFLLNFIPNFGSIIAVIIGSAIFLLKFGFGWKFGVVLVLAWGTQIVFGNYLEPKLNGEKLKLSPVLILISLFVWYWIWGVGGAILAIPLTSIIKITLENYKSTKTIAKLME